MNLLTAADWLVIAAYFIVLYAVVFRHSEANRANPTEFFLAGRNAGWSSSARRSSRRTSARSISWGSPAAAPRAHFRPRNSS